MVDMLRFLVAQIHGHIHVEQKLNLLGSPDGKTTFELLHSQSTEELANASPWVA